MKSDALSEILRWLQLKAEVYIHTEMQGCWAVDTSGSRKVPFHLVNSGRSWLHLPGVEPRLLSAGDLVIFPSDAQHFLSSESECPDLQLVEETQQNLGQAKTGQVTGLTCGFFEFESQASWPLLDNLPPVVVLELSDTRRLSNTRQLLQLLVAELEVKAPGHSQVVHHLTHVLFSHILRSQLEEGVTAGLLTALFHPKIGAALNLIHTQPENAWSLESLAREVGMSRAAFASEFRELTGTTAMAYLTQWRMLKAGELLRGTQRSIFDIAEACGYQSEVAFRKAFKSITGATPAHVRRSVS